MSGPGHGLSCLLVDDSEEFLASATRLLTAQGVGVAGRASSGHDALRLARELAPDVVLVDVELGDEDGIELARRLTSGSSPATVILISLRDREELADAMAGSGAAGFVRKDALDAKIIADLIGKPHDQPRREEDGDEPRFGAEAALRHAVPRDVHQASQDEVVEVIIAEASRLLESQSALRRIATLVAQGAEPRKGVLLGGNRGLPSARRWRGEPDQL